MQHGNRQCPDPRLVFQIQQRTVHLVPVRIGPVEHHDRTIEIGAGIHHPQHGYIIGVETHPHILHVDHQHVERTHRLIRRAQRPPVVERTDRNPGPLVGRTADPLARIGRTAESVLGREDPRDPETPAVQPVHQMLSVHHGRMVSQQGDPTPLQQRIVGGRIGCPHPNLRRLRPLSPAVRHRRQKTQYEKNQSSHKANICKIRAFPKECTLYSL